MFGKVLTMAVILVLVIGMTGEIDTIRSEGVKTSGARQALQLETEKYSLTTATETATASAAAPTSDLEETPATEIVTEIVTEIATETITETAAGTASVTEVAPVSEPATEPELTLEDCEDSTQQDVCYGSAGSLYIPSVGIRVALDWGSSQETCDQWNLACYFKYGNLMVVADHCYQEFSGLYGVSVGDVAYIEQGGCEICVTCYEISYGVNTGSAMYDSEGKMAFIRDGYLMYTCTDNTRDVLQTWWR